MIGAATLTTSCATNVKVHVPHNIGDFKCTFKPYTAQDELTMSDEVGRKIKFNLESCKKQRDRINSLINTHNQLHVQ